MPKIVGRIWRVFWLPACMSLGVGLGYFNTDPYSPKMHAILVVIVFWLVFILDRVTDFLETKLAERYAAYHMIPIGKKTLISDEELIEQTNNLAHRFYRMHGNFARKEYKFYEATTPQEVLMWDMACAAMEDLRQTDVSDLV